MNPDLAIPAKIHSGAKDGSLHAVTTLQENESRFGVKILDGDVAIDPNEAQTVEDFVTGLPIENDH